jgi:hypothetical protein
LGEEFDALKQHGLAASQDDVLNWRGDALFSNIIYRSDRALGIPRGIGSVAPKTSEVATTDPNKLTWNSRPYSFALDTLEGFRDAKL